MSNRLVSLGPVAPEIYPIGAWSRWPKGINAEDVWRMCGPTVEQHIDKLPLWKVFCAVYFEGLAHGAGCVNARTEGAKS